MKITDDIKPGLAPLVLSASLTAIVAFLLFLAIVSDSSGEPETGWGALIGTILLGPQLIILFIISAFLFIRYKRMSVNQVDSSLNHQKHDDSKRTPLDNGPAATVG